MTGGEGGDRLPEASMDDATESGDAFCSRSWGSFLKYSFRFRGGNVLLSRSAINTESDSGDEERSGDSGDDRGGVSRFSVPAMAASTCRTMSLDDLNSVTCEAGAKYP